MNIGVLCGGNSSEHEISIISALELVKKNPKYKFLYLTKDNDIIYINNPTLDNIINMKGKKVFLKKNGIKGIKLDAVVLTLHGKNAEDTIGCVLDFYNIPYIGSKIYPSIIAMDKELTYLKLKKSRINTLYKMVYYKDDEIKINSFPVIIKPARSGSSIGINVAHNEEEAKKYVDIALKEDSKIIVEPYLSHAKELCVALYEENGIHMSRVEVIESQNELFSFDEKYKNRVSDFKRIYLDDEKIIDQIDRLSKKIYKEFEFKDIIRIDFLCYEGQIYVNEINSIPGSLALYLFDDKDIIDRLVKKELRNYSRIKQGNTSLDKEVIDLNSKK